MENIVQDFGSLEYSIPIASGKTSEVYRVYADNLY
jgi:hypothetical protein